MGVTRSDSCIFCEYKGRLDHLHDHIAVMHPGKDLLATPPTGFSICPGKPNLLVMVEKKKRHGEEERNAYRWGFCYGCNKIVKSKKTTIVEFEAHCCKPKQVRLRKVVDAAGKAEYVSKTSLHVSTIKSILKKLNIKPQVDDVNLDFCLEESLKEHFKDIKKTAQPIAPRGSLVESCKKTKWPNKKALELFEQYEKYYTDTYTTNQIELEDDDEDKDKPYDECDDFLFPLIMSACTKTNKEAHQHETIEEQRAVLLQKDAEIDSMKEQIARMTKIIEHQSFR